MYLDKGYEIVGVFTIPDKNGREDILATTAKQLNIPVFKISAWRRKGIIIPEVFETYKSTGATLNVLPFCSQFIPMEVIDYAQMGSICYHPSVLPRHRGASAISWYFIQSFFYLKKIVNFINCTIRTLIEGDPIAGFTIFWADDGLDTGPILLTRECSVLETDTLDTLYKRFLYPVGVTAMG